MIRFKSMNIIWILLFCMRIYCYNIYEYDHSRNYSELEKCVFQELIKEYELSPLISETAINKCNNQVNYDALIDKFNDLVLFKETGICDSGYMYKLLNINGYKREDEIPILYNQKLCEFQKAFEKLVRNRVGRELIYRILTKFIALDRCMNSIESFVQYVYDNQKQLDCDYFFSVLISLGIINNNDNYINQMYITNVIGTKLETLIVKPQLIQNIKNFQSSENRFKSDESKLAGLLNEQNVIGNFISNLISNLKELKSRIETTINNNKLIIIFDLDGIENGYCVSEYKQNEYKQCIYLSCRSVQTHNTGMKDNTCLGLIDTDKTLFIDAIYEITDLCEIFYHELGHYYSRCLVEAFYNRDTKNALISYCLQKCIKVSDDYLKCLWSNAEELRNICGLLNDKYTTKNEVDNDVAQNGKIVLYLDSLCQNNFAKESGRENWFRYGHNDIFNLIPYDFVKLMTNYYK